MSAPAAVDAQAQLSMWGVDDSRSLREKRRKHGPKAPLPAMPDGPCCGHCAHWGACARLVVITERVPGEVEKGQVTDGELAREHGWFGEALVTRGAFAGCRAFLAI